MPLHVEDAPDRERFEARDGDADQALAGFLTYQLTGNVIAFTHMGVAPGYEGKGVDDALARAAMDDAAERRRTVVPICPTLSAWLTRHPQYNKIVAPSTRKIK